MSETSHDIRPAGSEPASDSSSRSNGSRRRPRIGITIGDPAGIGPEVVLKAVAESAVRDVCAPVIIGDAQLLAHTARKLNLQCGYEVVRRDEPLPDQTNDPV